MSICSILVPLSLWCFSVKVNYYFQVSFSLKVGAHEVTSSCNKSWGEVQSCELAIFTTKSSRRDQSLVPATSPRIQTGLNFLGQVPATWFSKHFYVRDKSLRSGPLCKLFRGLVAGTRRRDQSPCVCRP